MPERPTNPDNPPSSKATRASAPVEAVGGDIGPYRLLAVLGQGGFGVVYLAERRTPFVQRVALKVIKPGMDSATVIARFEQERQTLGVLDHPHIAKVFDAGTTPLGRPYFVMEHVAGEPLAGYCDRHALGVEARLRLAAQVCDAVHHAHQRGMIHRDLKPSNVLVAEHDGQAHAKVIDFGVAKALAHTQLDTSMTVQGQAIGTPEYMSPEQAAGEPPDARTDVYSLGVMIFELLTGELPFDEAALKGKGVAEAAQLIPDLPARRLGQLRPDLRGDLETIVLRATAREKARRYESAAGLGAELRRYLEGEPIAARRDSVMYVVGTRVKRAARRSPLATLLAAWLAAALVAKLLLFPVVYRWTPAWGLFQQAAASSAAALAPPAPLAGVRVVLLTDEHPPEELGRLAGVPLEGADPNLRALHGALMQKLAAARPRAVAWDIHFRVPSPALDPALAAGFAALDREGVPWVVGVLRWPLEEPGVPELTGVVKSEPSRWGVTNAMVSNPWVFMVTCAARADGVVQPSLALRVFAALRQPEAEIDLTLDADTHSVRISYWKPDPAARTARPRVGVPDDVTLTSVQPVEMDTRVGLLRGDTQGLVEVRVPTDEALAAATWDYAAALRAEPDALREWIGGRVLIVGDARAAKGDRTTLPDGRRVPGTQVLAAGTDAIIAGASARAPNLRDATMITLVAAGAGVIIGAVWRGRGARRAVVLAGGSAVVVIACLGLYIGARYLSDPAVPVLVLVVGSELAAWLGPARSNERGLA